MSTGVEFLVALTGPETSAIEVTPPYDPAPGRDGLPVVSPETPAGRFAALSFQTNRERIARDGTVIPAIEVDRGALRFGSLDPAAPDFDTRTDAAVGAAHGAIEIRIPWGLLNVADPSTHRVLHQPERHEGILGTRGTDGFRFEVFAATRHGREREVRRLAAPTATTRWRWPGWTEPRYRSELKHGAGALRDAFRTIELGGTKP
jgi:hypothetical protein